jgi:hypothetical protein
MTDTREFRLSTILSVTLHMPLCYEGEGPGVLLNYLSGHRAIHPFHLPYVLSLCSTELLHQLPWLAGVHVPAWIADGQNWAALWAWLDIRERRYGIWHPVSPMRDLQLPDVPPVFGLEEVPEHIREALRNLGIVEDDTPEDS